MKKKISGTFECTTNSRTVEVQALGKLDMLSIIKLLVYYLLYLGI